MTDATTPPAPRGTRTRKPRGQYAKSETTRRAILDAAFEVFSQSGYRAGSLRDVAQRVVMSEAGLLHHFKNKSALLQAVLDHRDDLSRMIIDFDEPDPVNVLRGFVTLAGYNASIPGLVELFCILSAEATSPAHPAHSYFRRRYEYVRAQLSTVIRRIDDEGRLEPGLDPDRSAVTIIALMDGLQVQWLLDPTATDMAQALAEYFRSIVRGYDLEAIEQALDLQLSAQGEA